MVLKGWMVTKHDEKKVYIHKHEKVIIGHMTFRKKMKDTFI